MKYTALIVLIVVVAFVQPSEDNPTMWSCAGLDFVSDSTGQLKELSTFFLTRLSEHDFTRIGPVSITRPGDESILIHMLQFFMEDTCLLTADIDSPVLERQLYRTTATFISTTVFTLLKNIDGLETSISEDTHQFNDLSYHVLENGRFSDLVKLMKYTHGWNWAELFTVLFRTADDCIEKALKAIARDKYVENYGDKTPGIIIAGIVAFGTGFACVLLTAAPLVLVGYVTIYVMIVFLKKRKMRKMEQKEIEDDTKVIMDMDDLVQSRKKKNASKIKMKVLQYLQNDVGVVDLQSGAGEQEV